MLVVELVVVLGSSVFCLSYRRSYLFGLRPFCSVEYDNNSFYDYSGFRDLDFPTISKPRGHT